MKSILLVVLMISMSLSAGIIEVSRGPWLIEEASSELEPPIPEPMYSAPADWELIASDSNVEVTENSAISDLTFNWTAWSSGVVNGTSTVYTSGDSGFFNDIAIDSNDKTHIVFYREDNTNIYHSTNATVSGNWETNGIDTSGNVGQYCSIAIDSNDGLHVSYQYNTGNTLKYAYKASGSSWSSSWSKTTVDNTGGKYTSIAIDSNDKPHISYRDGGSYGGDLAYAEKTSGSWSVSSPIQSAGDIVHTSIAIDSDDHIHIAYYDTNNKDMDYFTNTSGSWVNSFLEDLGAEAGGMDLDIAIDPTTDQPGISYFDNDATALKYGYYTGSTWSYATVENSADYGRFNSIAYDSLGNVHISHERNSDDDLYYTSDKTGSWVSTAIDTSPAGVYTAIAVDSNDDAHIAYRFNTNKDLYVATVQGHNAGSVTRTNVAGAACGISPSLPSGLTLNQGTCTISGTPTVAGSNTTYNLTATASTGLSKTGEFNLWVTPPAPNSLVYSPENMTLTKGTLMSTNTPSVGGGAVTGWEITPTVPSGLLFSSSTGAISGTPSVLQLTAVMYTVWANNSVGSTSASVNITINDAAPNFAYVSGGGALAIAFAQNVTISPVVPIYGSSGGMPTSCVAWPSLPTGLSISSACVITGTPTVLSSFTFYSIEGSNSGGSYNHSNALYISVNTAGGTLAITPTNTEGSVNSSISDITMSYTHQTSNYGWASGVSNTTTTLLNNFHEAEYWLGSDSGERGEMAIVYARNDTGASTHSLGLLYNWGGSWTETIIDNGTDTGHYPSVVIDRNGALHISYIDEDNDELRYATNASGSWVLTTLGDSTYDNDDGRGTAIVVHPITNAVHIVTTINDNTYRDLQYHTNETGSWGNMTITNTSTDEGHDPSMAMDGDGNLYVAYYCDDGCSDLRLSSRINGVWQNETVSSSGNTGNSPDIAIDSQGTIHIVSQYLNSKNIYLFSGSPGSWTAQTGLSGGNAHWPTVAVDSNDAVHISYHLGSTLKDVMYMTNASGSWSTASMIAGYGGWGSEMTIDENDDVFIPNIAVGITELQLTTVKGSGQGLTVRPIYDITPMLPDGLTMNWRNGTISGTPTEVHANTTHMVTVTALGTTTTATFTLFVGGAPGGISYSDISGTKGSTIVSVTPSITTNGTSGNVSTWAINATLPSGLTFETSNGTIWGTPSVVVTGAVFTIWANNSVGSKFTTVNITINDEAPDISYSPDWFVLTKGTAMSPTATPANTGGAIPSGIIDSTGTVGKYTSIAIDSNGYRHISYFDQSSQDLKYATDKSGSWVTTSVDTTNNVGYYTSIAVDSNDNVHISYFDNTNDGLKYATDKSGSWVTTTVDSTDFVGWYTSIAIDSNDNVHISYFDTTNDDLKYATDKSGFWVITSVDTTGNVGQYTSIAIDSNDDVHISYYDDTNDDLKYATNASGSWVVSSAHSTWTTSGMYSSIAVDSGGDIHISHHDFTFDSLLYSTYDGSSWTTSTVDTGSVGAYSSIALDSSSNPRIAYHANSGFNLKFASYSGSSWTTSIVASAGDVGTYTSIAVDSNDAIHISYFDDSNDDLGYVALDSSSNLYGYSVSPALPAGLSLNIGTGEISGTPTALSTNTTYTITVRNSGGTNTTTITIVVEDQVPTLSYPSSPYTIVRGYNMTDITPTTGGGAVLTWEISPSLPSGLTFTDGVISGKPFANQTTVTYTVYANNSGGSASATFDLTINEPTPNIDYDPDNYTLTNGTSVQINPILLSNPPSGSGTLLTGTSVRAQGCMQLIGDLIIFIGRDELPAPTYTNTGYELWAFNHTQSLSASNPYLIKDIYPGSTSSMPTANSGTQCSRYMMVHNNTLFFTADDNSGKGKELWKTQGTNASTVLVKDTYTGSQHGNPEYFFVLGDTLYFSGRTSSANNAIWRTDGTASGTVLISSTCGTNPNCSFTRMTEYNGSIYGQGYDSSGGRELFVMNGTSWEMLVDLSPGYHYSVPKMTNPTQLTVFDGWLYFETAGNNGNAIYRTNGTATGTTEFLTGTTITDMQVFKDELYFIHRASTSQGYELWKTDGTTNSLVKDIYTGYENSGFCTGTTYSTCSTEFQVFGDYMLFVANDGSTGKELWITDGTTAGTHLLKDINPGATGSTPSDFFLTGDVVYFRADDGTNGYELWRTDGTATGTVLVNDIRSGSGHSNPWDFLQVGDDLYFSAISPNGMGGFYQVNNASNGIIGAPSNWSISPALPAGLNFGTGNGTIWGTPTALSTTTWYNITATNANGSSITSINITINDQVPTLSYSPENLTLTKGQSSSDLPLNATLTGSGTITSWEISPALPSGLTFETSNGTVWGTPTVLQTSPVTYTIWANNSGGSSSATINITIIDEVPILSYSPENLTLTNNTASLDLPLNATLTGSGNITSWEISPALPSGLTFETSNGTVWGTPTVLQTSPVTYTIWANNSGGSSSATINITIIDEVPILSYSPENLTLTNNTASLDLPLNATLTGSGNITSWEINATLPAGLNFGTDNGTIWGIPTVLQTSPVTYTIWANNSGGSTSATINITILDEVPTLSYSPENLTLTNNTASLDLPLNATLTGSGNITSWEINATLPAGLNFGTDNGTIWGIPTILQTSPVTYTIWANNSGGSTSATINITILDEVPTLSYSPENLTLYNNTVSSDLPLAATLTGSGNITSWEINATLPVGLNFGTDNGTIWGIPTVLQTSPVTYTIWANNSGGSTSATINITILDEVPTLSYSPENLTLTNNTASLDLPLNATLTGSGTITSWEISPALPSGLTFETSNGTVWGIPTVLQTSPVTYTIWANNSGGSTSATINITILDEVPTLSYSPENLTLTNNTASLDLPLNATLTGSGNITSWEISPALPSGLTFETSNGTVWGIPTVLQTSPITYTIWANNSGGSSSATINITIVDEVPTLSYSPENLTLTNNTASLDLPLNATLTGSGNITSWEISPALPSGLTFETSNGTVWGIPTVLQTSPITYTIWANNSGGSSSATINITIVDEVPTLSYSPENLTLTNNTASLDLPLNATLTGSGNITSWEISPALPSGLTFETSNGTVWGIPTVLQTSPITYTIWANNSGGSSSATINITILDEVPTLSYSPENLTLYNNTVSGDLPLAPTLTGPGVITSWEINATLPAGLNFGTDNGTIWGTPTVLQTSPITYTIWANNSGGSSSATINITIVDEVPTLSYSPENLTLTNNTASLDLPLNATLTGSGNITSWEINATLPAGLNFGTDNGTIWGTPTVLQTSPVTYTIWGNNSGGSSSATINITILDEVPTLSYSPENLTLTNNTASLDLPLNATLTGSGNITSWEISPALPSGLTFETSNGTVWGIPTVLQTSPITYTIWANNSGGSSSATINITIVDEVPVLSYSPENLTLTNNTASLDLPLNATLTGSGNITSWEINATLPAGLNFGTDNGTIWGIPTVLQTSPVTYTIWANNSGGSSSATINITILDEVPTLSYSPENLTLYNNTVSSDLPLDATLTGSGNITSWEINATLPAGLNFGFDNGTIWGTPTVLQTSPITYTIWANNSGGSSSATINITILDEVPTLYYSPENLTLTNNTASVDLPLNATLTGSGNITSWEINATLPAGLNFGTDNGTIWGIPTVLQTSPIAYTIWANNSGGSTSATINITIVDEVPTLSYSPENLTLTNNTASLDLPLNATLTGSGNITSWEINATLPAGLNFGTDNGTIWGIPTVLQTNPITYTIWANNSGGSSSATINITILDEVPTLSYSPENLTLTNNTASLDLPLNATLTGSGNITSWEINATLPAGLNFGTDNGTIWGIPTVLQTSPIAYTIWANNSGGSSSATINITIVDEVPTLSYSPENLTLYNNTVSSDLPLAATLTGSGNITSWEINATLPAGLNFGTDNGTIWGIPTVLQTSPIAYTIWANNSGGSSSATINITINDQVPNLSYSPNPLTLTRGVASSDLPLLPTLNGSGDITSWEINATLPAGLNFGTDNGTIWGTPVVNMTVSKYTVWANNSGGSTNTTLFIIINEPIANITYAPSDIVLTRNTTMVELAPTLFGGTIESWEIQPAVPAGLLFVDGVLTGTPTVIQDQIQYSVWANNSGGSLLAYLNITILDILPEISYVPSEMVLTNNTSMGDWSPNNTGGPVLSWDITPGLSPGLIFNPSTGVISGTPTQVVPILNYTVSATNSGGTVTVEINITVLDQLPMIEYVPNDIQLLNNSSFLLMEPLSTGGATNQWSITPPLSSGLTFNLSTGVLSGMPIEILPRTVYAITVSNDVGSDTFYVNITVEGLHYDLLYPSVYLLNNSLMDSLTLDSNITGAFYEIEPSLPAGMYFGSNNATIWGTPTEVLALANFTVFANSSLFHDTVEIQIAVLEDTDLDKKPDTRPAGPYIPFIEDLDDDADGFSDLREIECDSDPLNTDSVPGDIDGDTVCNFIDEDIDGDGLVNVIETDSGTHNSIVDPGTSPHLADTDGDGVCDGPKSPVTSNCTAGPDAFPHDPSAHTDTDGDGMPDNMFGNSTSAPPLVLDLDDDNDLWSDIDEVACGTEPLNYSSTPVDTDGDGICDALDDLLDLPFTLTYPSENLTLILNQEMVAFMPNITGLGEVATWEISAELPDGLTFGWSPARDALLDGSIRGMPTEVLEMVEFTIWANNSAHSQSFDVTLTVNEEVVPEGGDDDDFSWMWCFPCLLFLLLLLLVPLIFGRDQILLLLADGPEPENTTSAPEFVSGAGTQEDPFVLKPIVGLQPGESASSIEVITIDKMSDIRVEMTDLNELSNGNKFCMFEAEFGNVGTRIVDIGKDGEIVINMKFDDGLDTPTFRGGEYNGLLKLGRASVYISWSVKVKKNLSKKKKYERNLKREEE